MYEKRHPKYALSLEKGTPTVPNDDRYHVLVNDEIILSTKVFEYAKITYEEEKEKLRIAAGHPDPREIIRQEAASRDLRALRAESIANRVKKDRGGPGGRGGVG
jgi:hypothetical protein